jgi:hypothetical protein
MSIPGTMIRKIPLLIAFSITVSIEITDGIKFK